MSDFKPGPTIEQIPTESTQDAAPKKRRGRPPKDPNAPVTPRKPRTPRGPRNLKDQIGGTLVMVNMGLMAFPPTRRDALDVAELEMLTDAIDNQCKVSPTFRKYVIAATGAAQGGQLVSVLAIIGARRMARHDFILPPEVDDQLGKMIGVSKLPDAPSTIGYDDAVKSTGNDADNGNG